MSNVKSKSKRAPIHREVEDNKGKTNKHRTEAILNSQVSPFRAGLIDMNSESHSEIHPTWLDAFRSPLDRSQTRLDRSQFASAYTV